MSTPKDKGLVVTEGDPSLRFELLDILGQGYVPCALAVCRVFFLGGGATSRGSVSDWVLIDCMCVCVVCRSYGVVQKGIDKVDGGVVAIKIIPCEEDISDLMKEISILQECQSDEIVGYKGAYEKDNDLWVRIVMLSVE